MKKKKSRLWVYGCSYSTTYNCEEEFVPSNAQLDKIEPCYPQVIADHFNLGLVNRALEGLSFNDTRNMILNDLPTYSETDSVFIQETHRVRFASPYLDSGLHGIVNIPMKPAEMVTFQNFKYLLNIVDVIKSTKVNKVYFLPILSYNHFDTLMRKFDERFKDNLIELDEHKYLFNWIKNNRDLCQSDKGHLNEEGHEKLANEIISKMKL